MGAGGCSVAGLARVLSLSVITGAGLQPAPFFWATSSGRWVPSGTYVWRGTTRRRVARLKILLHFLNEFRVR